MLQHCCYPIASICCFHIEMDSSSFFASRGSTSFSQVSYYTILIIKYYYYYYKTNKLRNPYFMLHCAACSWFQLNTF